MDFQSKGGEKIKLLEPNIKSPHILFGTTATITLPLTAAVATQSSWLNPVLAWPESLPASEQRPAGVVTQRG